MMIEPERKKEEEDPIEQLTAGVDRTLSGHTLAVATRIAAPPAHRPDGHRDRRNGSRQGLLCAAEVVALKKWASVPWQPLILAATIA
jgi:hypothetical protein